MAIMQICARDLAAELAGDQPPVLLDVRSPQETREGVLPGAMLVPMHLVPTRLQELPRTGLVVYCHSGARSYHVCSFLEDQGVVARNLQGGIIAWAQAGQPIVSPQSAGTAAG